MRWGVKLDRPGDIALGVFKEDKLPDPWDRDFGHHDGSAIGFNRGGHRIHVGDRKRALLADHPRSRHNLAPLLERTLNGRAGLIPGADLEEIGRSPRLKLPAEDVLVEAAGPGRIVRIDSEMRKVVGHPAMIRQTETRNIRPGRSVCYTELDNISPHGRGAFALGVARAS